MAHTQGPWTYNKRLAKDGDKDTKIYGKSKHLFEPICRIPHDDVTTEGYREVKANAHLIASAPDLLEALDDMCYAFKDPGHMDNWSIPKKAAWNKATEAIRKAKGLA
jgi:hypothetical protein